VDNSGDIDHSPAVMRHCAGMDIWWQSLLEHDGLLMRDRVLGADIDPDLLLSALRSCRLRRIQRSVYAPRAVELTPLAMARAAVVSSGIHDAVASHGTAARVHGIVRPAGTQPEHVTVRRSERRRNRRDLVFHGRALRLGEVEVRDGVPLTTVARTLVDLAGSLERLDAVWAIDDALRRSLCGREQLDAACARYTSGGGATAATRVAEADGMSESILETAGRLALMDFGVPLPVPQYRVFDRDASVIARLDGAYPHQRLGLEFDGRDVHERPEAVLRDRQRQNRLEALGWNLLRFTWWDVTRDPERFARSVQHALVRRQSA
jgi:REase_MTES_1575